MTNWLATEITDRIVYAANRYGPNNPQQLKQLHKALCHTVSREVYFGVMGVFCVPQFEPQKTAGRLLMEIKPEPCEPPGTILRNILGTWNLSVEELPWYLAEKFGIDEMLITLDVMENESVRSGQELVGIKTFRFWLPRHSIVARQ